MSPRRDDLFAMTGMPRSGTTYLAAVLYHPPRIVTLSEAGGRWKSLFLEQGREADVLSVFEDYRNLLQQRTPLASFAGTPGYEGEDRIDTWNQQKVEQVIDVADDFVLGMKNPEVFLEWLPGLLRQGIRCLITVRHPLGVINSWVRKGQERAARGRALAGTFANGEAVTYGSGADDVVQRRIDLHNHFAARILDVIDHEDVMIIRYEDWFTDAGQLDRICEFLNVESPGELRPAPIPPDPITLHEREVESILRGCLVASRFGYDVDGDALRPPATLEAPAS